MQFADLEPKSLLFFFFEFCFGCKGGPLCFPEALPGTPANLVVKAEVTEEKIEKVPTLDEIKMEKMEKVPTLDEMKIEKKLEKVPTLDEMRLEKVPHEMKLEKVPHEMKLDEVPDEMKLPHEMKLEEILSASQEEKVAMFDEMMWGSDMSLGDAEELLSCILNLSYLLQTLTLQG